MGDLKEGKDPAGCQNLTDSTILILQWSKLNDNYFDVSDFITRLAEMSEALAVMALCFMAVAQLAL